MVASRGESVLIEKPNLTGHRVFHPRRLVPPFPEDAKCGSERGRHRYGETDHKRLHPNAFLERSIIIGVLLGAQVNSFAASDSAKRTHPCEPK